MLIDHMSNVIPSVAPSSNSDRARIMGILLRGWWKMLLIFIVLVPAILAIVAYKKPQFTSEARIYITKPQGAETALDRMAMPLPEQWTVSDIQTEIGLIKSEDLATRVFTQLGLNATIEGDQRYVGRFPWYWEWLMSRRDTRAYLQALEVTESRIHPDIYAAVNFAIHFNDDQSFTVISSRGGSFLGQLGKPIETQEASFILSYRGKEPMQRGAELRITISPIGLFLEDLAKRLSVNSKRGPTGSESNLIEISYKGESPYTSQLFVNTLLDEYIKQNKKWAMESALSRLNFIHEQQKDVSLENQKSVNALGQFQRSESVEKSFTEQKRSSEVFSNLSSFLLLEEQKAKIALASLSDRIHVIDRPSLALKESTPRLIPTVIGVAFFSFFLACAAVVIPGLRVRWFASLEEIKAAHFYPVFVNIPHRTQKKKRATPEMIEQNPQSRFGESIRLLRTNLLNSMAGKKSQVVLVTSPMPGDGKSTVVFNLATVLANSEYVESVLVIDSDMYRPSAHAVFALKSSHGLSSFLNGSKSLKDVIESVSLGGGKKLSVVCAGPIPPSPVELVETRAMQELLEYGRQHYTFVLIDTPPYPISPTAAILAKSVDRVLTVARIGYTHRNSFNQCVTDLEHQSQSIGMVIIMDKTESDDAYGYYGSYYGYGKLKKT